MKSESGILKQRVEILSVHRRKFQPEEGIGREQDERENHKNRIKNEEYVKYLDAHKRKLKPEDFKRIKLHKMQSGKCLYTGRAICREHLFDGSIEIDHILPYAITGDNRIANLALVFKEDNQFKRKRSPFEAFSSGYNGVDYANILGRAKERGGGVYWRFKENAMEHYKNQEEFENRYLNDTRYISRMSAHYLSSVCTDSNGIVSLNGRITSDLRHEWGLHTVIQEIMEKEGRLNSKDIAPPEDGETLKERKTRLRQADKMRLDHRHHLVDAIVAACATRSDVQRLQTLAARNTGNESPEEILAQISRDDSVIRNGGVCWQRDFRSAVKAFLEGERPANAMVKLPGTAVVRKADHDPRRQLHEATNYGLVCEVPGKRDQYVARQHVAISELKPDQIKKLRVPETAIAAAEQAMCTGARIWWGGEDPVSSLRNLARDLEQLRAQLLNLMQETPAEILAKQNSATGQERARAQWATRHYINRNSRRRYTKVEIVSLQILKGPLSQGNKPRQVNQTGGNDRLIYFIKGDGHRAIEVVSTLKANTPGFRELWRRDGGRLLFVLRKNDLVEMVANPKDPKSNRRIYRTVSLSGLERPDLIFLPVEEARQAKQDGSKSLDYVRISSVRAFNNRMPELILFDPTGRERWRSRHLN